jgi:hypothetical protein
LKIEIGLDEQFPRNPNLNFTLETQIENHRILHRDENKITTESVESTYIPQEGPSDPSKGAAHKESRENSIPRTRLGFQLEKAQNPPGWKSSQHENI